MGCFARCWLGTNDAPCNCHNAFCCFFNRVPCCGCNCLETYDEQNRKDMKKMRKDQKAQMDAQAAAPAPNVMTQGSPVGAPQMVQPAPQVVYVTDPSMVPAQQ